MIKSKSTSESYTWGNNCKAWHLVNTGSLSVIQEMMPPNTEEQLHQHQKAQQFFYILKGTATFKIGQKEIQVEEDTGIHIEPSQQHKIQNNTNEDLEFLVISEPHAHNDRINIDE